MYHACRDALAPLRQQSALRRRSNVAPAAVPVLAAATGAAMPAPTPPAAPSWPVRRRCRSFLDWLDQKTTVLSSICMRLASASAPHTRPHSAPPAARKQGAKPVPFLASIGIGLALRFLVPVPVGIDMQAWTLLSIFVSTIAGGCCSAAVNSEEGRLEVCS